MSIFLYSLPGLFWNRLFVFFQNWLFADLYCTIYFQSQVNKYVMFFFLSLYVEILIMQFYRIKIYKTSKFHFQNIMIFIIPNLRIILTAQINCFIILYYNNHKFYFQNHDFHHPSPKNNTYYTDKLFHYFVV
jgi:hypothetical protein